MSNEQKLREALLSDMDIAVLRMPVHLAFAGNMAQFQYHNRVQALLDRIEALATPTAEQVDDINVAESFTSVTKTAAPAQGEPFGYFRAEPFGWTDCSEDAEGAIALYEHPAKPAQEVSDKHEREMLEVIDERDRIHEWADQLADAIAKHTGYEIGEHTSGNNPWRMALNALVCHQACHEAKPAQEVGLTDRQFDLICQAIDKADTVTMDGDYMLDSDDCIRVVRVMQVLFDIAALRAKGGKHV